MKCQICFANEITQHYTKCCRLFICLECKEGYQKKGVCCCGKSTGKKLTFQNNDIFEVVRNYYNSKPEECYRCQDVASVDCVECQMLFCKNCNTQVHNGLGFAKHHRKLYEEGGKKHGGIPPTGTSRRQLICKEHNQSIVLGCQCGTLLCNNCNKTHKEVCQKGSKTKSLRQFKEEYFLNLTWKLKQITILKEKLGEDKLKYTQSFQKQKQMYQASTKTLHQQFQSLKRMLQIKVQEIQSKQVKYWKDCQKIYLINLSSINQNLTKYDDLSRLIQRFSQNLLSFDYIQSKIKRCNIAFDFYSFKAQNIDQVQNALLNLTVSAKQWQLWNNPNTNQTNNHTNTNHNHNHNQISQSIREGEGMQRFSLKDDARYRMDNIQQLLYQYTQHPERARAMNLTASHNQIWFSFLHLPHQQCKYEIQYGVGIKMKGQEVFKKLTNSNGFGMIEGLNSASKYRIRMRVVDSVWGQVGEITTLDIPKFQVQNCLYAKSISQCSFQFSKAGTVYGSNQINFGTSKWIIRIVTSKNTSYDQTQTACMSVGVSNKENKKTVFVGYTLNYGYQKEEITLKVFLNCQEKKMVIWNSATLTEQIYQNLPTFPIFPTVVNKGNSQVIIKYNLCDQQLLK